MYECKNNLTSPGILTEINLRIATDFLQTQKNNKSFRINRTPARNVLQNKKTVRKLRILTKEILHRRQHHVSQTRSIYTAQSILLIMKSTLYTSERNIAIAENDATENEKYTLGYFDNSSGNKRGQRYERKKEETEYSRHTCMRCCIAASSKGRRESRQKH